MDFNKLFFKPIIDFFTRPANTASAENREEEPPRLFYRNFTVKNFKGIRKVEVSFARNHLVLLLGLNESGKTTILKSLEAFDYLNDPVRDFSPKHFHNIRRKADVNASKPAIVTAELIVEAPLPTAVGETLGGTKLTDEQRDLAIQFLEHLNHQGEVTISRVFPFDEGSPRPNYYQFEKERHAFVTNYPELSRHLAVQIVQLAPFIIYFEDFKDRVPERVFIDDKSDSFDPVWYDIIDGLFFNTNKSYSIESFVGYYNPVNARVEDAKTVLRQVNKSLNDLFTKKWRKLSGVKGIDSTELEYDQERKCFQLKVYDTDGTNYSVEERSKGALWYLSFLMKTEFRSKKLRLHSGKPVFLIDEPASNLHSTAQRNMVADFVSLVEDTCLAYTTHSQYLISPENVRNTYVIRKQNDGAISATPWSEYLRQSGAQISYYQPLANLLELVPNTMDVPWHTAVLTEGPSDRIVLRVMHRVLFKRDPDFVIYPGTNAHNLGELISLNIGWGAKFAVLLDGDEAGKKAATRYKTDLHLKEEVLLLPDEITIERMFSKDEQLALFQLAFPADKEREKASKKQFAAAFSVFELTDLDRSKLKRVLSDETLDRFRVLFADIGRVVGTP